jgi:hypothetical protein
MHFVGSSGWERNIFHCTKMPAALIYAKNVKCYNNVSSHQSSQDLVKAINYKDYLAAMFKYDIYFIYYN